MSPVQTNTQSGIITRISNANLSASEGCLAKVVATYGATSNYGGGGVDSTLGNVDIAGVGDIALYVIVDGGDGTGYPVSLLPLDGSRNVRVIASTTLAAGVQVAPDASGHLRASTTGDYTIGILEESCVQGQYALVRPGGSRVTHA